MSSPPSRAEFEAMDREELVKSVAELSESLEEMQATVDLLKESVWEHLEEDIYGKYGAGAGSVEIEEYGSLVEWMEFLEQENERLRKENEQLRDRIDDAEATAKGAYTVASSGKNGEKTKTQVAEEITRNLLVKKVYNDCPASDRPVTITDIQDKAEPDYTLKWATVRNAFDNLREDWPQFYDTKNDGQQALSIRPSKITPALAKVVQEDLGRHDLAKRFVGDKEGGGA